MAVAVVDVQVNSQQAVSRLREINNASKQAQTGINQLSSAVGGLIKAYAAFQAVKFVFVQTAEIESQTRSLQVLTGSVQQAKQIVQELQALGAATPFTSAELIDAAKRLQAFGVEANKVVDTTRRLADVSGATGAELQGLVTAFGQVQAKGRLQGEELLQFQERGIALQKELQRMYGMSGEEFRQSLEKGRFSAEAVEQAVINLTNAGGQYANGAIAQSDTLQGRLSTLQDSFQRLAQNIGNFFAPVFKFLINRTDELINRLNRGFAGASEEIRQRAAGQRLQRAGVGRTYKDAQGNVYSTITGRLVQAAKTPQAAGAGGAPPALLEPTGGAAKGKSAAEREAERAAEAAKKEAERVAEVIRARTAEAALIRSKSELQDKITAAEMAGDAMLVVRLQGQQRGLDLQFKYAEELARETNKQAEKAIIFERQTALVANQREVQRNLNELQAKADQARFDALKKHIEQQYELNTAAQNQLKLADGIANTLGQSIGGAFDALIAGSESWGASLKKIASGVLIDIAKQLLQIFVIEQAINALRGVLTPFSAATPLGAGGGTVGRYGTLGPNFGIPQRARGGSVMSGGAYLVGERGPELFMPGRSGGIAPNGSFGGGANVVVNVDASGTNVQGDSSQGKQLGSVIAAAVQAELVKQQRPGGLLAR